MKMWPYKMSWIFIFFERIINLQQNVIHHFFFFETKHKLNIFSTTYHDQSNFIGQCIKRSFPIMGKYFFLLKSETIFFLIPSAIPQIRKIAYPKVK